MTGARIVLSSSRSEGSGPGRFLSIREVVGVE